MNGQAVYYTSQNKHLRGEGGQGVGEVVTGGQVVVRWWSGGGQVVVRWWSGMKKSRTIQVPSVGRGGG